MLQYKNGKYELYSKNGFDMVDSEENRKWNEREARKITITCIRY